MTQSTWESDRPTEGHVDAAAPASLTTFYPWGRLDHICNSKTNKSVSVSVIIGEINLKTL